MSIVIIAIASLMLGGLITYLFLHFGLKNKRKAILQEAETEAEVIKKNKLLEVKEKFLNKKAELEKEVTIRNQRIQQAENKLKQRELMLKQRQEEVQRKRTENENFKANLDAQMAVVDKKKDELDKSWNSSPDFPQKKPRNAWLNHSRKRQRLKPNLISTTSWMTPR